MDLPAERVHRAISRRFRISLGLFLDEIADTLKTIRGEDHLDELVSLGGRCSSLEEFR